MVLFFQEDDGSVPFLEWLSGLPPKAQAKCLARVTRLEDLGHELRRPEAEYLAEGIYELRAQYATMNYRMLYFFHGRMAAIVSHGFAKQEARVPALQMREALRRKRVFEASPRKHSFKGER